MNLYICSHACTHARSRTHCGYKFINRNKTQKKCIAFAQYDTFSPIDTPPDVTTTSTFLSAESIPTSSESGLFNNINNYYI